MPDATVQLAVAVFNAEEAARQALNQLKMAQADGLVDIRDAAVLRKDRDGKVHIEETSDWGGGRGAAIGGVAGAAVGLVAGAALLVPTAVGALIGGLSAKWRDWGVRNDRLGKLGADLKPGSSAIIVVAGEASMKQIREAANAAGGDALVEELGADIAAQLEADHDVAYAAIANEEGVAIGRVSAGEDDVEGGMLVADEAGIGASAFDATEEGFAVEEIDVDAVSGTTIATGVAGVADEEEPDEEE
ncbi:MAG TPA: DUF1269 domain-containing protein [Acidimicrobiia bacterium]|jgi:uncharacterized membrane protein|nr:DUF1269 domain-containing protein [Acidimicrobiia bacterium]